jgi:3-oxoacyl-[acyl-carrier-protein] synthase-1/3-oxoacyl-[acyl-carrier-protein] synthase II
MSLEQAFASMLNSDRNPQPPKAFHSSHVESYPVFEILSPLPTPNSGGELLRTTRLALSAVMEALADAGLSGEELAQLRVGVCVGTTVGCAMNNEEFYAEFINGADPDMAPIDRYLRSNPAAAIAKHYQLDGPCLTVVNACSSGTDAIGIGASWIRSGLCDVVLAGGADELCRVTYNGFASLMINDTHSVKPFDAERKGLNLGEGAGILVLESAEFMAKRMKIPRGYILGYGSATDAYHLTAPHPEGRGLRRALSEALQAASISPGQIAFINAHGTGTPDNDKVESLVLSEIFPDVPFISTKGYTGHTLGAAGAIEAALTLVCLEQQKLPANIGFRTADPQLPVQPVSQTTVIEGKVALSESLAFGGNNSVVIIALEALQ